MPNGRAVKARGRNWETAVVMIWRRIGFPRAKRNGAVFGSKDRGDVGEIPVTCQAKAVTRVQMWQHLDEALEQARHNGTGVAACVVYKRHHAAPEDAAWVLPGRFAEELLRSYYS
ncbi:hypothetical protein GCM10012275_07790 [Longimycelium tulufanense]|uniref:Uncharacterized protein n=1 Tax=Longimycelium tulufanense TaxID=907463 RepID=A0A8J3FSJ8_9PSEU|nr:hypothetical protein [Longimycelium tulufanense]GGM39308.1 hypothetical protein GCM10012275_07790 [Longimycelium tulufanense]